MYSQDDLTKELEDLGSENTWASWEILERVAANVLLPEYKQYLISEKWEGFWRENCDSPFK